jgi:hypothetical protein
MKGALAQFLSPCVWIVGMLMLAGPGPAGARIVGGRVTGGSALSAGGTFVQLVPPLPNPFGPPNSVGNDNFQSPNLYGFNESQNILLTKALTVNVGTSPIPSGTVVASHYIFFDPGPSQQVIGTIDFDATVLGILTSTTTLAATDFLAQTGVNYLNPTARGLEAGDSATISGERQVHVDFTASSPGDYIRVLTATSATANGVRLIPVTPCRLVDTRGATGALGGPRMAANTTRDFELTGTCGLPSTAQAYSLNITVVPQGPLGYLTIWPTGQPQPLVSTLNAPDGRITANAAVVPAGTGTSGPGSVSVFVTSATDVIIDVDGYLDTTGGANSFYTAVPCRVADTRGATGPLGGPTMTPSSTRSFPVPSSSCGLPATANGYSMNVTVVPAGPLGYLTVWPTGQIQPVVSTLNSPDGAVVANAAIVPAGSGGAIDAFVTDRTDLILDVNGYFGAPGGSGALSFYPVTPCRVVDTRNATGALGGPSMAANSSRSFPVESSTCAVPTSAKAYSLNVTVVPAVALSYLTLYPTGQSQPLVSTLNSYQGLIVANAAIVPAGTNGGLTVYVTDKTDVILDINGYFAQ